MKLPVVHSWDRAEARKGKFNGKFIIGVLTTGIYCLPSCPARQPKPQNVRLFTTEAEAKAADALELAAKQVEDIAARLVDA